MNKIITDKSILVGDEKLIKKRGWVPFSEINESLAILNHKIFKNAFNKIIRVFKPKHKIAFFSLCTSTRPYQLGRKWKVFKENFDGKVDLIVVSSGGIIPEDYWNSYPFLTYDGHTTPKGFEKLYSDIMSKRLTKFLKTHKYDYIVANFRPNLRNAPIAEKVLSKLKKQGLIKDYHLIPNLELYKDIQSRGFPAGKVFPDLDVKVLEKLNKEIDNFNSKL